MHRETLPDSGNVLTFGILSIVLTLLCCGPFGGIFGIIGLSKAKKAERIYHIEPERYSGYDNVKTGRILSYIGIALAAILLVFTIIYFGVIAAIIAGAASEGAFQ
ncbi:CCC motif membrane protein [Maribacter polysaccharolyticus]|uniref:CCC motif membrane protein n=1 Tax=Maribacter polysaccharolyticus TaxID=3020831 RepID=UPI00237F3D22|nr:CCC motif membrane protein [Maribacter polysaccharolyticus]MDE3743774.1 CCC motif membrane protein [Maribacter polysaccharolyticus]